MRCPSPPPAFGGVVINSYVEVLRALFSFLLSSSAVALSKVKVILASLLLSCLIITLITFQRCRPLLSPIFIGKMPPKRRNINGRKSKGAAYKKGDYIEVSRSRTKN